jgi:hypothetical protein
MATMVKVRPGYGDGSVKEMDIEELDALYTKPIDDRVKQAIDQLRQAIKLTVKTGIEYRMVMRELDERRLDIWADDDDNDDWPPSFDGTWDAWYRNRHKAARVKAERAKWQAERAAKAESASAAA